MLTERQKQAAQAIVNCFETSRLHGDYGNVTFVPGDLGGLTYGRSQTTLNSSNLYLLIADYVAAEGAQFASELEKYLPQLQAQDSRLNRNTDLRNLLREAGQDLAMQETQDRFFDRVYWVPSVEKAQAIGIETALGTAVVYDSNIHGSWRLMRDRTNRNSGTVASIGERQWIARYVQTRRDWLANHSIRLLRKTVYRMDAFQQLIDQDKWDLAFPFTVRGLRVDEAALAQPLLVSAEIAPTRLLMLRSPYLQGADVRDVQLAIAKAGIAVDTDGIFGRATAEAVKQFQRQQGLKPDGIVGRATLTALAIEG